MGSVALSYDQHIVNIAQAPYSSSVGLISMFSLVKLLKQFLVHRGLAIVHSELIEAHCCAQRQTFCVFLQADATLLSL